MIVNGMMGMIEQDMYGHKRDQDMGVRKVNRKSHKAACGFSVVYHAYPVNGAKQKSCSRGRRFGNQPL